MDENACSSIPVPLYVGSNGVFQCKAQSSVCSFNTLLQSKSKAQMSPIPNKLKFNMVKDNAYIMY